MTEQIKNKFMTNIPDFEESWEDYLNNWEMRDNYDNQCSFFDSPEVKDYKEKNHSNPNSITKMQELLDSVERMPYAVSDSEILDNMPSVFDDAESYEKKYDFIQTYLPGYSLARLEKVTLLEPDEIICQASKDSNSKDSDSASKEINVVSTEGISTYKKLMTSNTVPVVIEKSPIFVAGKFYYMDTELVYQTGDETYLVLGNFWIKIVAERVYVFEEVNEQNCVINKHKEVKWKTQIFCMGRWFDAEVNVKTLLSDTEFLKITHDRGYLEPEREVKNLYRKYINTLIRQNDYAREEIYASTGWTKLENGSWVYLTDKGAIGKPNCRIFSNAPYRFDYAEVLCGSKEMFDDFMMLKNLCINNKENSIFLTYYTVVASLTSIFQEVGHGVNFVVALIGATNSQKTSTALIFSRFFDRSNKARPDIRFNSTEVAIMETMETYGDAILLVDDFLPYEDRRSANEQLKKSETIIRSYGDRVPRRRSKAYSKMNNISEYSRVKGCCMITGEVFDTNSESSATRIVQMAFEPGGVDLKLLSYFQNKLYNVPTFLYDFICFAQDNMSMVMTVIKETVLKERANPSLNIKIPRFRDTYGIMASAVKLLALYAKDRAFMTDTDISNMVGIDLKAIEHLISINDVNTKVKSPASTICYALKRALRERLLVGIDAECAKDMKEFSSALVDYNEYWCILPETLYTCYLNLCKFTRKDVMYKSAREISFPLKKEGLLLEKEESGKTRYSHKIKSKSNSRFLYLKKNIFERLCAAYEDI